MEAPASGKSLCFTNPGSPLKGISSSARQELVSSPLLWIWARSVARISCTVIKALTVNVLPGINKLFRVRYYVTAVPKQYVFLKLCLKLQVLLCGRFAKSLELKYLYFNVYPQTGLLFLNCPGNENVENGRKPAQATFRKAVLVKQAAGFWYLNSTIKCS